MSQVALPAVPEPVADGPFAALRRLDWWLLGVTLGLVAFGMLMIFSASSIYADQRYGDPLYFVVRQGMGVVFGLVAMVAVLLCPMRWIRSYGWVLYLVSIVGLVLVFTPLGHRAYGAVRWISLGPIKIQPSEFARIGLVLALGMFLARNRGRINDVIGVISIALVIPSVMFVLLMFQPDFGTTVLTALLVVIMLIVGGLSWAGILTLLAGGGAAGAFLALRERYRAERIAHFLDPLESADGAGYQVVQGWIAMASGGWTGQGLGGGIAQRGNLPEAHTDFIAAVVGEDLGVVGIVVMVGAFVVLIWRGFSIAMRATDLFGTLVATALSTLLASQALVNLGVLVGWAPPKGLVLPFLSYGASAVVAHLLCVALLLRISMHEREPEAEVNP